MLLSYEVYCCLYVTTGMFRNLTKGSISIISNIHPSEFTIMKFNDSAFLKQ